MSRIIRYSILVLVIALSFSLTADEEKADKAPVAEPPAPFKVSTQHRLNSGGTDISYTANAEEIYLKDGDDNFTASYFTFSYIKNGTERPQDRPITFIFNNFTIYKSKSKMCRYNNFFVITFNFSNPS